jgi:hypothetical protein
MSSRNWVILLASVGIIAVILYYLTTHDSNLWTNIVATVSGFLVGLIPIYLIVERRINEEKRARLKPVEYTVMKDISSHAIAVVRLIGIYIDQDNLGVEPLENNKEITERTESFAKKVIKEGLQIPQSGFRKESAVDFSKQLDRIIDGLFSLQIRYPYVIEEYPDVARILSDLGVKQSSVGSAFYWVFFGKRSGASEHKQLAEKALVDIIKVCDELAEATSKHLEHIAGKDKKIESTRRPF